MALIGVVLMFGLLVSISVISLPSVPWCQDTQKKTQTHGVNDN